MAGARLTATAAGASLELRSTTTLKSFSWKAARFSVRVLACDVPSPQAGAGASQRFSANTTSPPGGFWEPIGACGTPFVM